MSELTIAPGFVVSMQYTLRDDDGDLLDSSEGDEPLLYLHGADNIVPGLESQLAGHSVGDKLDVVVKPEDGYGLREDPEPELVERENFPEDEELEAGMEVIAEGPDGELFQMWIVDVSDEGVMVDHNHPLAGVTLHFAVEISAIREATEQEREHGHPHGLDGHGVHEDDEEDED